MSSIRQGATTFAFAAVGIAFAFAQQQYSADTSGAASDDDVGGLEVNIPGIPGEDYPIYAEVPDTGFTCDGQVEGGKYADPGAECQAFHVCALGDMDGGLLTYSF